MSGKTSINNNAKLVPREQQEKEKKRNQIKIVICLLLSNLFCFLLSSNFLSSSEKLPSQEETRKGFERLTLSLKLFVPLEEQKAISLYSPSSKLLVAKAYLIKKIDHNSAEDYQIFEVEVPQEKWMILFKEKYHYFLAYPHNEKIAQEKNIASKVRNYEVLF